MKILKIDLYLNVDWFYISHRLNIAQYLNNYNYDITAFAEITSQHNASEKNFFLKSSPYKRKSNNICSLLIELINLFSLILKRRADIVHAVTIKPIILVGLVAFILDKNFIASISGLGPGFVACNFKTRIRKLLILVVYRLIFSRRKSKIICQSNHDAAYLLSKGVINRNQLFMIPGSGVNLDLFKPQKKSSNNKKILLACRLLYSKGVVDYLKASSILKKICAENIEIKLVGPFDFSANDCISPKLISELCLKSGVDYIGEVNDLSKLLNETDIFVYPSYYAEGIPKVLIEACSSGCAIVTTNHPGCRDAVAQKSGIIVPVKDPKEIAKKCLELINNKKLIKSLSKTARNLAIKKYDINLVNIKHQEIYDSFRSHL